MRNMQEAWYNLTEAARYLSVRTGYGWTATKVSNVAWHLGIVPRKREGVAGRQLVLTLSEVQEIEGTFRGGRFSTAPKPLATLARARHGRVVGVLS